MSWSSKPISVLVRATLGGASGTEGLITVIQKIRQLRMQKTEIKLTSRSAVLSFDSRPCRPSLTSSLVSKDLQHGSCLDPQRIGPSDLGRPEDVGISHGRSDARCKPRGPP